MNDNIKTMKAQHTSLLQDIEEEKKITHEFAEKLSEKSRQYQKLQVLLGGPQKSVPARA
jgi:hypothetical protein